MKKALLTSIMAAAVAASLPQIARAQAGGSVQLGADEYKAYNDAATAATPAAKAAGFEAYLSKYPNSSVKQDALTQMMFAYQQAGDGKGTVSAADRLLAVDPNNFRALVFEVYFRRADADAMTDVAAKQAALDTAAGYAQKALAATAPTGAGADDFNKLKAQVTPTLYSAIADDDITKKDNAGAITALKTEIDGSPEQTKVPSPVLQDVYTLAQAYYTSTPPDYLHCAYYGARGAAYAPEPYKTTFNNLASYCYKKYHGKADGYDTLVLAVVKDNLDPPAGWEGTISAAPKPADFAHQAVVAGGLETLNPADREFIIQYGVQADADAAFNAVKGKSSEFPDLLVVSATTDAVMVAVSDDAVQSKTADFTFKLKEPLAADKVPAAGAKVTLNGTYDSYTQTPLMINMSDAFIVEPKKEVKKAPVHHPAPAHHPAHK